MASPGIKEEKKPQTGRRDLSQPGWRKKGWKSQSAIASV